MKVWKGQVRRGRLLRGRLILLSRTPACKKWDGDCGENPRKLIECERDILRKKHNSYSNDDESAVRCTFRKGLLRLSRRLLLAAGRERESSQGLFWSSRRG